MRMISVVHIITRLDKGGSSENTLLTCIGLDKTRFRVTLAVGQTIDAYDDLIQQAIDSGVQFVAIPALRRTIQPFYDVKAFFAILALLKRNRFDIVHVHSSKAGFIGRIAAKIAGVQTIIYTPHGHVFYGYFNRILTQIFVCLEKACGLFTDKIIALTEGEKADWLRFKIAVEGTFAVIHSGVPFDMAADAGFDIKGKKQELQLPDTVKIVGSVGRLVDIKGYVYLIEAVPAIIRAYPSVLFIVVGDGPLRNELEQRAVVLGIAEKVRFLGWRQDLWEILSVMDIFVLCSVNEGMGRVLVQAHACSKPIVATNIGGIKDVVVDNRTGFLVPPRDSNAIADAVVRLLSDTQLADTFGKEGKQWVMPRFGVREMINKVEKLYQQTVEQKRG